MSLKPMFTSVAKKYDLLNRLLTFKLDGAWRETCAKECACSGVIVDLCCGTGDLALHILKHVALETQIVGLDFSKAMLAKAINKKHAQSSQSNLSFITADAAHLPFKDASINCIGISFSFRNLIYRNPRAKASLKEIVRSLRATGKLVCVETSQPQQGSLRILYHLYLRKIVPLIGWLISKRKNAYGYLGMSATNFPSAERIAGFLLNYGFEEVTFERLTLGLVALHVAVR